MKQFNHHKVMLVILTVLLLGFLTLLVISVQKIQDNRSHAEKSTTLTFTPDSTLASPIIKNIQEAIPLDLMVHPGNNLVTVLHFVVTFDQTKLEANTTQPVSVNTAAFPTVIEGPFVTPGRISMTISIGSDPTKAISTDTKAATITLKAIGPTGDTPTAITFSQTTEVLSSGVGDQATENVLNSSSPAYISIPGSTTSTGITFNTDLLLHGIGHSGDNANPSAFSLSNQSPAHPQRNVEIQIIDGLSHTMVATATGTISYNQTSGNFTGSANLDAVIPPGQYLLKITSDRYLRRYAPGITVVTNANTTITIPQLSLVTSDSNNDNRLNILDYNMILDCYTGANPARACSDTNKKTATDANDDDTVNQYDYNLFLRELSVQNGD